MPEEAIPSGLQESILALLVKDAKYGAAVALQVRPEHFDTPYQEIVTALLNYWREFGRPPGFAHLDDLFGWRLVRGDQAPKLRRLLSGIVDLSHGINADYVVGKVQGHIRRQTLKSAILRAGELYQAGGEDNIEQVEQTLYGALRTQRENLSPGTRLSDTKNSMRFLDRPAVDVPLGIEALDRANIGAARKRLLLYIGPKGTGKSWFCVHMGRQGLLHRQTVLHVSNEMDEAEVLGRYYQNLFAVSMHKVTYARTSFELDEFKRLISWDTEHIKPKLSFKDNPTRKLVLDKLKKWGVRLGSLIVKEFPSGSLTMAKFNAYLDYLEQFEKFVPTLVIMDYPDLMKQDAANLRISIGRTFVDLRGNASERNYALIAPTQGGRATIGAKRVRSKDVAEDISKVMTADVVLSYSQTEAEKRLNLARLNTEHARGTHGGQEVIISQGYSVGQYVLESALMSKEYWAQMEGDDVED